MFDWFGFDHLLLLGGDRFYAWVWRAVLRLCAWFVVFALLQAVLSPVASCWMSPYGWDEGGAFVVFLFGAGLAAAVAVCVLERCARRLLDR